jgi:hypothetical protein
MYGVKKTQQEGFTDLEETILYLSGPYMKITSVCWFLSLYCIIDASGDYQSVSFVLGVITGLVDSILFLVLYFRARRIRKREK